MMLYVDQKLKFCNFKGNLKGLKVKNSLSNGVENTTKQFHRNMCWQSNAKFIYFAYIIKNCEKPVKCKIKKKKISKTTTLCI